MEGEKGRGDGPEDCLTFQGWEWKCTIRLEGRDGTDQRAAGAVGVGRLCMVRDLKA